MNEIQIKWDNIINLIIAVVIITTTVKLTLVVITLIL